MKSIKISKNVFIDLLNFYQMKNLFSVLIILLVTTGAAFAQSEIWDGNDGRNIQIVPADGNNNTAIELKGTSHTYIDFTNDRENYLDHQSRIIGNKAGNLYFQNRTPNSGFVMENKESHGHLHIRGDVKSRSSVFLETGLNEIKRTWELTNRGLEYPTKYQPGKFMLNHFNGEKWLAAFEVKPYKNNDKDYFKISFYGNTSVSVANLEPAFKNVEKGYEVMRLGTPQEYFGGLMYNKLDKTNKSYGDGNDFTIFTYGNRDMYLRTSNSAKTVVPYGTMGIGTSAIPAGYKMAIDGKVICEELKVQLSQNWADYVFDKDYDLTTLEEVEATIEEKGHLHNTPSAAQLEAEGGVEISKITVNQQEKIEEIFLHLIELNKTVKSLKEENDSLKAELNSIK